MMRLHLPMLDKCPKKVRKHVARTATTLHCAYWGHAAVESFISLSTPMYVGLFILTLLGHYYHVEQTDE